ncbi:unnamed protein product [Rotaria socialis]|uniref:Uncharacterized protein n=1 Tax=Rotaria socialis TaxID=392032 RepID=A0A818F7J0_9BILA|nr:unnamed protein product [Rotaria socialis]CAF3469698.1 unnamed protein product [Rotaria socialis]CAF3600343.1 unnamed protein product [Rotaria socialis]CAF4413242.1 unnamed protein product [Rotaria socialis]CAF4583200.1 unnamed protein product [Rotaria socialis]
MGKCYSCSKLRPSQTKNSHTPTRCKLRSDLTMPTFDTSVGLLHHNLRTVSSATIPSNKVETKDPSMSNDTNRKKSLAEDPSMIKDTNRKKSFTDDPSMSKDTNRKNSFTEDISLVWKLDDITYFDHDPIEESSIAEKHLNLENFVVIWLDDQFVDKRSRDVVRAQVNYLEVFYDVDQCVDEISEIDTDKIFLIVSENYFNQLALILESFEQVHSVYILCYNQDIYNMYMIHDFALSEYRKLAGYFIDIDQISHAIRKRKAQLRPFKKS